MILTLQTDWNIIMKIGAILAFAGVIICLGIVSYCMIRMEYDLKTHKVNIPLFHLYKPFVVYREYNKLIKSKSNGPEKDKLNRKILLTNRALLIMPIILMIGLLIMVIGKSL